MSTKQSSTFSISENIRGRHEQRMQDTDGVSTQSDSFDLPTYMVAQEDYFFRCRMTPPNPGVEVKSMEARADIAIELAVYEEQGLVEVAVEMHNDAQAIFDSVGIKL